MSGEGVEREDISERRRAFDAAFLGVLDRLARALTGHWLFAINALSGLLAGLAFLAPLLLSLGLAPPARAIYLFYSYLCHQLPQRSFFVFGYQVAQCQRNTAIYVSMFLGGIAYAFLRPRLKPLDLRLYALLLVPIVVDGGTQLLGWRESTWELRAVTGTLFGIASVWFGYPYVDRYIRTALETPRPRVRRVVLYGKADCSLCDKAKEVLDRLREEYSLAIEEVDITTDPDLMQRYKDLIPVVHVDGRVTAVSKVSEVWLRRKLDAVE